MRTLVLTAICVVLNGIGFVTYKAVSAADDAGARFELAPLPIVHEAKAVIAPAVPHETPLIVPMTLEEPPPVEPPPPVATPAKPVVRHVVVRQPSKPVEPPPVKPATKPDPPAKTEAEQKAEDPLLKMEANPYKRKD